MKLTYGLNNRLVMSFSCCLSLCINIIILSYYRFKDDGRNK